MMRHVKTFFGGLRIGNLNPLMAGVVGFALALTGIACLVLGAEVKLTASDAATGDRFGYSVSIDGQYAIIGAKEDDDVEETGPGAAYIYHSIENLSLPVELATLTAQAGDAQITLTWSPNTEPDFSHCVIYRSQTQGFSPTSSDSVGGSDQPDITFTDTGLTNGVTYYYRISAVDETGNESAYSDEASATPISAVIPAQTWTQLSPTGGPPAKRSGHSAVYNASTNRMIVFGGCVGANIVSAPSVLNDVWVLENADGLGGTPAWVQLSPTGTSPSARAYHPAVYDPTTNRMIVFGGNPRVGYCRGTTNDIWVLEHADGLGGTPAWHSLSPTSATGTPPGVRNLHCAVYDPDTNRLMVFGGQDACESDKNDVWVLEHANGLGGIPNWILLAPTGDLPDGRSAHSAMYDPGSNRMIIYGGAYPYKGDVWALENANGLGGTPNWIELLPDGTDPIRIGHTAVYQASTNRMIVFGGGDTSARKNDVWVLSNANGVSGTPTWTELDPTGTSLDNRVDHTAVYNPATKRMIILGGSNCTAGCYDLDDVWVLAPDLVVAVPEISLSADSYDFGEVYLGASSDWTLTVSNVGVAELSVTFIAFDDPVFTVDRTSFSVAPGGNQDVSVTFRPTEGGAVSGILTLTSNDPDEGELDILLSGVGKTTFVDVAGEAGVGNTVTKGGIAWGDYDGDGDPDLFAVDSNPLKGNVLYRNEGGGRFSDVTSSAGVGAMGNSKGGVWGDFDNDGDPDLYVTRSGAQNILYRNEGDGVFSDISEKAGVDVDNEGIGAVWVDYDNDGWLDLYTVREPVKLYRNGGDGAFADVTDAAGVGDLGGKVENGAWGDYDNDGDVDLYVSNRDQANVLFRNEGDGTFVDGTLDAGVPGHSSGTTLSAVWGDYDNDGNLDLYVLESNGFRTNLLYRNNGSGTFTDVTETAGVGDNGAGTGAVWGDFDNDGDLDLYVSNGGPLRLGTSFPNVLYRNEGDGTFTDVGFPTGTCDARRSWGTACADYDGDGDLDLYVANDDRDALFRNEGNGNAMLIVKTVGTTSNRSGIGARVRVVCGSPSVSSALVQSLSQIREVCGGSNYAAQNSLPVEFGLGAGTLVDSVIVRWPGGIVQVLTDVGVDQILTITEKTEPAQPILVPDPNLEAAIREALNKPTGDLTEADLASLNTLDAPEKGISDLSGIEHCTTLTWLSLWGNRINILSPLAGLPKLGVLYLGYNQISDLSPLSGLARLAILFLDDNQINDVSPLAGLPRLADLGLGGNQITDLSPLAELPQLTRLWLHHCQLSDLSSLAGLTQLTELGLWVNQISDPSALSGLTQLTVLNLSANQISDLTSLSGLTQLTHLSLSENQISDLSPLSGLTQLTRLELGDNLFDNLSPLSGLTQLTVLNLHNDNLSNLSHLAGLTQLKELQLSSNLINDVSFLAELNQLTMLSLLDNQISDLSPLAGLNQLTNLELGYNLIGDLSPLAGLNQLTWLNLRDNQISDLSALIANTGIDAGDEVYLEDNPLNADAYATYIPELESRGVTVYLAAPPANFPPLADAGPDQTVAGGATVTLDGTGSSDADGSVTSYLWTVVSSPEEASLSSAIASQPTFTPETSGIYIFSLMVKDNNGAESNPDEVKITVPVPADSTAPAAPVDLEATPGDGQAILTWSPNTEPDLSRYIIYRSQTQGFTPMADDSVGGVDQPDITLTDTGLTNGVTYYYRLSAVDQIGNESGYSDEVNATPFVLDTKAPQITSTPVTTQAEGRDLIMSASVTDAGGVQSVTLYYRAGGARTFTSLPMSKAGGDTYEATIPGSAVTYCGLEYYLSASDYTDNVVVLPEEGADNPYYVRVTFQDCIAEAAYPVGLWKMIGVPVMPDNGSPLEILTTLGAYDISKWRLFRFYWGAYHEFTHEDVGNFVPGRAFWLHTRIPDFRFRAGGGRTTPTDASFAITLDQGWTDIACPFAFPVSWDDVMAESGDPAGVSGPYTYDGAAWSFPNPADRLEPWEGYAVKNASTVAVTLNIPPRSAEASARPLAKPLADGEWMLRVKVYTDDFGFSIPQPVLSEAEGSAIRNPQLKGDVNNFLGFRSDAQTEWDRLDLPEPPPAPGEHLSLYFPHEEWTVYPDMYTSDFRPESDGAIWTFVVEGSPEGGKAVLSFDGIADLPPGLKASLLDVDGRISVDLREGMTVPVTVARDGRTFRIAVGSAGYVEQTAGDFGGVPDRIVLSPNRPNPFNAETVIAYQLSEPGNVRLGVYDLLGREVAVLVDAKSDPGYFSAVWDGKDGNGNEVGSGVYVCVLETSRERIATKMVMVR